MSCIATAQLCTGSLGDPVVNINFGNAATTVAPLKAGITNLNYVPNDCPNDGNYTIISNSQNCFGASWHSLSDHTGDAGGRFMLINASVIPNDFYVDTVNTLCGNTTYEFGAWVANVLKSTACNANGSKPNLSFTIETLSGTVLGSYSTGTIVEQSGAVWKQYGFFFKPDINTTTIVLRIRNNAAGGCGNDLALDDITFRPCGPTIATQVQSTTTNLINVCSTAQMPYQFNTNVGSGYISPAYQWQVSTDTGRTWSNIAGAITTNYTRQPTSIGFYQYRMLVGESANIGNNQCRTASGIITINVGSMPPKIGTLTVNQCKGGTVQLAAASGSGSTLQYQWTGPNNFTSTIFNPAITSINLAAAGTYIVTIKTSEGCTSTDTTNVQVFNAVNGIVSGNSIICLGDSTVLTAGGGSVYKWAPSTGLSTTNNSTIVAKPTDTTQYYVLIGDGVGCFDSLTVNLRVVKRPFVNAGIDQSIMAGNSISLAGSIIGQYSSFLWNPTTSIQNANSLTPTVSPLQTITYQLTATALNSCGTVADSVTIKVFAKITAPNAFTPNGDGINDIWIIPGLESYSQSSLTVFNRAGQIVYQSKPYNSSGWDGTFKGKALPVGTYYFIIERGMGMEIISGSLLLLK